MSKSSIFRTLFPRLLKLYTVVYISWCRSVLRWSSDSRISPLVKETAKPETISTTSWSCRCLKVYINSSISLHTTPVYWVWVSVYRCLYFVAAFSLNLHWSWLQSCCILQERAKPGIVLLKPRAWIWRCLDIYIYIYFRILLHTSPVYWVLVLTIPKCDSSQREAAFVSF